MTPEWTTVGIITATAIAGAVALAIVHPELPATASRVAPLNESVAVKTNPEPLLAHAVRTVPVPAVALAPPVEAPLAAPQVAVGASVELSARVATKPKGGDVCARHGLRRVDEGRKWHCERPPAAQGRVRPKGGYPYA
jgi:hypothetical protein